MAPLPPELLTSLGYALFPTLGAAAGAALADRVQLGGRAQSLLLHVAVGVVMAVVGVELLPRVLRDGTPWLMILLFLVGGLLFIAIDRATAMIAHLSSEESGETGHWVFAIGIGFDFITDGILIGVGSALEQSLGLLLGLGLLLVDVPEGLAAMTVLKRAKVPATTRRLLMGGLAASILLGAGIGWAIRGLSDTVLLGIVAVTAGMLATLVIEEMTPQAHRSKARWEATVAFLGGFAVFAFLTVFVG